MKLCGPSGRGWTEPAKDAPELCLVDTSTGASLVPRSRPGHPEKSGEIWSVETGFLSYDASRKRSEGLSTVTIVFGAICLFIIETLAPMTEFAPMTVSPPRTVAFE